MAYLSLLLLALALISAVAVVITGSMMRTSGSRGMGRSAESWRAMSRASDRAMATGGGRRRTWNAGIERNQQAEEPSPEAAGLRRHRAA